VLRYASLLRWTEIRTRWQEIQQLRRELFSEGGVVITVPPDAADGAPLAARTVVQPDGDVVCFVSEAALHAGSSALGVQMRAVHEWYRKGTATVTALGFYLRALHGALTAVLAVGSGTASVPSFGWWSWGIGVLVTGLVLPLAREVTGRLLRRKLVGRLSGG
jgi:hypothetical protein